MERLVVTPAEAADMLATSPNRIYTLLESGELPAYRQGSYWKIPVDILKTYVTEKAITESKERRSSWPTEK